MFFRRRSPFLETAAGTRLSQGFASVFVTAPDGLKLHVRRYGSRHPSAQSVVCLPGLARTAADFHSLATALAADPASPRLVLALDYRGHGQSQYDRNHKKYTIRVALDDLWAALAALEITSAIFYRHVFWWRTCYDAGSTAADCSHWCYPQRHRARVGASGLDAHQKLCGKAPHRTQLQRGRGNSALVVRAKTPPLGPIPTSRPMAPPPNCNLVSSHKKSAANIGK
jgi:hypothetical protein